MECEDVQCCHDNSNNNEELLPNAKKALNFNQNKKKMAIKSQVTGYEHDKHELSKFKQRQNRDLSEVQENQILSARLRSESGRVYSSGVTIDSTNELPSISMSLNEQEKQALGTVEEESTPSEDDISDTENMACSGGKCCKKTSQMIKMMRQLQKSMDKIKTSTSQHTLVSAGQAGDIRRIEDKTLENEKNIEDLEQELTDYKAQLKLVADVVIRQDQQIATLNRKITDMQQREMHPNIVITGIPENAGENPIVAFNKFVANQLEIQELIPVHRAFRIGTGATRPLIAVL